MHFLLDVEAGVRRGRRRHALAAALASACAVGPALAEPPAAPRSVEFRSGQFPGSARIDLSRFNRGNVVLPGVYPAAVQVNGQPVGPESLRFETVAGTDTTQLCVDRLMLDRFGVDLARVDADADADAAAAAERDAPCRSIEHWVPGASARFDPAEQVLAVQLPQLYLSRRPRDYVSPAQFDRGVPAALLQYNANLYDTRVQGIASTRGYLGLRAGINAGGWLLRHQGSLAWSEGQGSQYQASSTFAQRDIVALQSQFLVGQLYSRGDLFGSVRLRGLELATDDRMLPQSMVGYAPVVRGVAQTNALVRVQQRGVVLREMTVAPGPFEIDDLYAVGYGGDLEVVVREADGREKSYAVPFTGTARLLRPGYSRYALSAGYVDSVQYGYRPYLVQAQLQRGLSNAVTGYVGALKSEHYAATQIGAALNTPAGALSLDLTQSRLALPQGPLDGQSVQLRYSKQLPGVGTSFSVGAYRYSTEGYVDVSQALRLRAELEQGGTPRSIDRQRSRLEGTVNQTFGRHGGALYASASSQDYWNRGGRTLSYSLGYSNSWGQLGYSLAAQRSTRLSDQRSDNEVSLTMTLPLGRSERAPLLNSTLRHDRNQQLGINLGVNGTAGADRQLQYGINAAHRPGASSGGANAQYKAPQAIFGGSYSQGQEYRSTSLDVSGGIAVHAGGVTLAPSLGETVGLIHAPAAAGAKVGGGDGARVDARGYALVPSLMPYRFNTVELDPRGMSTDVELKTTSQMVAPRHGALVRLEYVTDSGRAVLIKARQADGRTLPFAANVFDHAGNSVGSVGQGSRLQVRSNDAQGVLTVRWGRQADQQCQIVYELPARGPQRQQAPDVIDQAVCRQDTWFAVGAAPARVSAAPPPKPVAPGAAATPDGATAPRTPPR